MKSSLLNGSSFSNGSQFLECDRHSIFSKLWIIFCSHCFILGFPATLIVLRELHKRSSQRVSSELFMFNLSIADLAYIVFIPLTVINFMEWNYMAFDCINIIVDGLSLCARPLFMACICLDCYFAVVHPITYRTNKKINIIRKATSMIVWLITISFVSPSCAKVCFIPYAFYSAPMIVALPVIAFCDISILRALRKPDPTGKRTIHPQKKQALHTIFNSLVVTFIAYLPPVVIFSFADVIPLKKEEYLCKVFVFGLWFSMTGSFIMPFLYLDTVGKLDNLKDSMKKYIWN